MTVLKEINEHFEEFIFDWSCKFYFLLGGYGSGKSHAVALKIILKLLAEKRTVLVVRNVFETHRDSSFSLLKEIVLDLGLEKAVKINISPMKLVFSNGSTIIFKGMDKPEKLKSINDVSIIWVEECSEITYAGFKELLGRLRHSTMSLHFILSTNPVDVQNWTYTHFFESNERKVLNHEKLYALRQITIGDVYYHHSIVDDNKFIPKSYVAQLEELKDYDTDLFRVGRMGKFGTNGTKVLPNFVVLPHDEVMEKVGNCTIFRAGMDFGFETSYNALLRMAVDESTCTLYLYWEYYLNRRTDDQIAKDIIEFRNSGEPIIADSAEPKTIKYFQQQGFLMTGAKKFNHSRLANIKKMRRFRKIVCSEKCVMTISELANLVYAKKKNGELIYDFFNIDPHSLSAIWYGLDGYEVADLKPRKVVSGKSSK